MSEEMNIYDEFRKWFLITMVVALNSLDFTRNNTVEFLKRNATSRIRKGLTEYCKEHVGVSDEDIDYIKQSLQSDPMCEELLARMIQLFNKEIKDEKWKAKLFITGDKIASHNSADVM